MRGRVRRATADGPWTARVLCHSIKFIVFHALQYLYLHRIQHVKIMRSTEKCAAAGATPHKIRLTALYSLLRYAAPYTVSRHERRTRADCVHLIFCLLLHAHRVCDPTVVYRLPTDSDTSIRLIVTYRSGMCLDGASRTV